MIFLAVVLATFWAWEFIYTHAEWLPEYIAYFLVPAMSFGLFFLPHVIILSLASAALVGILHRIIHLPVRSGTVVPRKRSNIPPLP